MNPDGVTSRPQRVSAKIETLFYFLFDTLFDTLANIPPEKDATPGVIDETVFVVKKYGNVKHREISQNLPSSVVAMFLYERLNSSKPPQNGLRLMEDKFFPL